MKVLNIKQIIKNVKEAQTQPQIVHTLRATSTLDIVNKFTGYHYQCRYSKNKQQWANTKSKKTVDLNNAKTMALTALRYIARPTD